MSTTVVETESPRFETDDGLSQHNPSPNAEIIGRGREAMDRKRRDFEDWMSIGEALEVGRTKTMRAAHTNEPKGKRYEKAMAEWLKANSFDEIDKGTRACLLMLATSQANRGLARTPDEAGTFPVQSSRHWRKWKASTVVPDPNAARRPSTVSKLKESVAQLEEDKYRLQLEVDRAGGDLWTPEDTAEDIARVMLSKLSANKLERVARAILQGLKERKTASSSKSLVKTKSSTDTTLTTSSNQQGA